MKRLLPLTQIHLTPRRAIIRHHKNRPDPKRNNTQKRPTQKRQIQEKHIHLLPIRRPLTNLQRPLPGHRRILRQQKRNHPIRIPLHDPRNHQKQRPKRNKQRIEKHPLDDPLIPIPPERRKKSLPRPTHPLILPQIILIIRHHQRIQPQHRKSHTPKPAPQALIQTPVLQNLPRKRRKQQNKQRKNHRLPVILPRLPQRPPAKLLQPLPSRRLHTRNTPKTHHHSPLHFSPIVLQNTPLHTHLPQIPKRFSFPA